MKKTKSYAKGASAAFAIFTGTALAGCASVVEEVNNQLALAAAQQAANSSQSGQTTSSTGGRSMAGLEPIGPIAKPGCDNIEIIGYAEDGLGTGQKFYYVAIRNNTSVSKLVSVRHIGGRTVHGKNREQSGDITVKGGQIKQYQIDLSINPPKLFEVNRCR